MEDQYLYMIQQAQEFMNENHFADVSRLHCLLRKMMPKEYHDRKSPLARMAVPI